MDTENKQREDFISTVSHELRTPLTSIRGFAQTMLASWDALDDESKKNFIGIIEEQSNRLIHLTENMLSVNKLIEGEKSVFKAESANALIEPIVLLIEHQYPNHKFVCEFNRKIPEILIDSEQFQQIITNLVENAAKYSPEGTTITIRTDFSSTPEFISIKVIDQGVGIKAENLSKIFEKFSRVDNPLTRKVQGSGLGLYITKILVEKMKGKISVESSEKGSTFEVLFLQSDIENQAREKCL